MKKLSLAVSTLFLIACGTANDDRGEAAEEADEASGGVIGEAYVDALDKAEAVEDLADERKSAIDDATDAPE